MAKATATLGTRLRALREGYPMTRRELSMKCDVTEGQIAQIEGDRVTNPRLYTILAMIDALDAERGDVLEGVTAPS